MSKVKETKFSSAVPEGEEIFPGVRITRRIALQNSAAAVLVMALGLQGCDSADADPEDEEQDPESGKSGTKSGGSKSGGSKGKQSPESGNDASNEGDADPSQEESQPSDKKDPSPQDPSNKNSPEPEGDNDKEPEPEGEDPGGEGDEGDEGDDNGEKDDGDGPLSLDEIVKMVVQDAKKLVGDKSLSEADYQKRVNRLLARLDKNEKIPKISSGPVHRMKRIAGESPIHIFVMEMAPNANIPLHDHSNRIGNILGWRGTIKTVNYSFVDEDEARPDGSFLLQKSDSRTIEKGQTGYLGRKEHNCHIVTAGPQGATLLDMFTYYDEKGAGQPGVGSRFVSLGEVVDKEKEIYRARYSRALAHLSPHDFS